MKSGESIILTTHRVSFNGVLYNMILTTQRLILVDSGDTRSDPRTIPLVLLQSATAGDGAAGEPLLTLPLGGTAGTAQSGAMNLSFPRHFGKDRRRERNEWIKKLNTHTASARHETVFSKLCAAPGNMMRFFGAARIRNGEPSDGTLPGEAPPGPAAAPEKAGSPRTERPAMPNDNGTPDDGTGKGIPLGALTPQVPAPAGSVDAGTPADPMHGGGGALSSVGTPPPVTGPPPAPPPPRRMGQHTIGTVALVLIFILGVAAGAFLYSQYGFAQSEDTRAPVAAPESTAQPTPAPTPAIIPREGTWVRVVYNGTFVGWVGNPGALQHVGGFGEQLYWIRKNTSYVQASFQKQDYSGKTLTVEVYSSGVMTYRRTVRSPMGEVAFLIDPRTAEQPGVTPAATKPGK